MLGESGRTKRTALFYAAERGYDSLVSLLIPKEARMADVNGFTALMVAAQTGHIACVQLWCSPRPG